MAASLYKAQFALRLCEDHDKKELHAYCKTCKKKICSSCIKEEHHQHDWETITDILREKKHSLAEECKEIRAKQLPDLKRELCRFDKKIEEEDARFQLNKSTLNGSRQSYISEINRLFDDRIDECRQKSESVKQIYKDKREALKQKAEYLETMTTALGKDINTLPDHDILDMEKEMRDELEKALSYSADKYTCTTVFVSGQMDVQALENMIGEIHKFSVEEQSDIDKYSDIILSLEIASGTSAWVRTGKDNYPKLIHRAGEELRTMKVPCTDLICSGNGDFVLVSRMRSSVIVLNSDEDIIRTISTSPLHPTEVLMTLNNDILLTLRDDDNPFNHTQTSRNIVQRMTLTGEVLQTYEFQEDGKTRLFIKPMRMTENNNTDICVVNWISDNSGEIVVLHNDGRLRFTYRGDGLRFQKFHTTDVECDSKGRILFTERYSRSIHMLSAEGRYICTLRQFRYIRPYVISIHGDDLWCGFKEGRIKVLKYTNSKCQI